MSRSGYSDDYDFGDWQLIMYRGAVKSAIRGRRGQSMLRDLLAALDAMPEKRLVANELEADDGEVCALGALGKARGVDMSGIDPDDSVTVAATLDVAESLAREIVFENDEASSRNETPEQRWSRIRQWVAGLVKEDTQP